jgi:hypothetical protein
VAGSLGQGGGVAERHSGAQRQQHGRLLARSGPVSDHDGARAKGGDDGGQDDPSLNRRMWVTDPRSPHPEEEGETGRNGSRGEERAPGNPPVFEPGRHGQRDDEAEDEKGFDERKRPTTQRQELKEVSDTVKDIPHEPQGLAGQLRHEAQSHRLVGRLLGRGVMLEDRGHSISDRAGERQQDDREDMTRSVMVVQEVTTSGSEAEDRSGASVHPTDSNARPSTTASSARMIRG